MTALMRHTISSSLVIEEKFNGNKKKQIRMQIKQ